jgi:uncharacterized membrane protein YgcG
VPLPQTYSGDAADDVDEVLFSFENYLGGNNIARSRWTVHAMQLLKGKALAAYIAFAQPLQRQGITPTWEQFVGVMHTAFVTHDRQMEARNTLFNTTQTGSVTAYLQTFRVLISRAGSPAPGDKDLLLHYWKGLKQGVKDDSKIDPTTGAFWTSFEDLAKHTVTISRQHDFTLPDRRGRMERPRTGGWRSHTPQLHLKPIQMKSSSNHQHPSKFLPRSQAGGPGGQPRQSDAVNRGRPTGNRQGPVQRGRSGERGNSGGNTGGGYASNGGGSTAGIPRPGQCTRTCGPPNRGVICCGGGPFHRTGCPLQANGNA